jgi:hypothetical protein
LFDFRDGSISQLTKIRSRAFYDTEMKEWTLKPLEVKEIAARPLSAVTGETVAVSRYSSLRAGVDRNPRYKCENTIDVCSFFASFLIFSA